MSSKRAIPSIGFILLTIFSLSFVVSSQGKVVHVAKVEGAINPVSAEFTVECI